MSPTTMTNTITHRDVQYSVTPEFKNAPDMLNEIIVHIGVRIRQLEETTGASHGMISMEYREARGMIYLLACVCECPELIRALETHLLAAKTSAADNMLA